jgi:amidohydrolase
MYPEFFLSKAKELFPDLINIRRHIHAHPELSFNEFETSKYIQNILDKHQISFTSGWVSTGILAELKGNSSKTIGIRADMDALPIQEKTTVSYASNKPGVMHACGHDVHMTCALGAAIILNQLKNEPKPNVKILFQPGEEKLPGGASLMIEQGVLEGIDQLIALHVYPHLSTGIVGFRPGNYMASSDEIYIKVIGKGGHGALPHLAIDPITVASKIVIELKQITTSLSPPSIPTVLTIGKFEGLGATNVIPDVVHLEGTFRTMNEEWRNRAHQHIHEICNHIAGIAGARVEVNIIKGYPVLYNDEKTTLQCMLYAEDLLGENNVVELDIRMTAEDFAYYSHHVPACLFRLGTGSKEKNTEFSVHHPEFNIDEDSLITGAATLAFLAYKLGSN